MAGAECVVFLFTAEERIHAGNFKLHVNIAGELVLQCAERCEIIFLCIHGRTHGCEKVGIIDVDGVLFIEF